MRRVLITGAGRGIGLSFARQCLDRGDAVFATVRDRDRAADLSALAPGDGRLTILDLDAGDPASIDALGARLERDPGALDLLIANAGISSGSRDFAERAPASQLGRLDGDVLVKMFAVNAIGPLLLAQRALPLLARGADPRVVFLSTQLASITNKLQGGNYGYGASKAALNMFARALANDLRQQGSPVRVVAVHPGWVRTDMGGPGAPLSVEESTRGILALAARLTPDNSGAFLDWQGRPLPF